MHYLSEATVREIIALSVAQAAAVPQDQTKNQMWGSLLAGPGPEEKALQDSLDKLSHPQALHLAAMMYAGRYLVETESYDDEEKDTFEDVYNGHLVNFKSRDTASLIRMCEDKAPVLHRYLKAALENRG